MNIIVPLPITASMIEAGTTLSEPHSGETEWVSGTSYVQPTQVIRSSLHKVYKCSATTAFTSTVAPESDPNNWTDMGPTRRWAAFDLYTGTKSYNLETLTYNFKPGAFFNSVLLMCSGSAYSVTIRKDSASGDVIYTESGSLLEDAPGFYEYLFGQPVYKESLLITGLPLYPTPYVSITVTNGTGQNAYIGGIVLGDFLPIIGEQLWGGTQWGAVVEPKTYSTIETNQVTGELTIERRYATSGLKFSVVMPLAAADTAVKTVQGVLDVPVACVATEVTGFLGLRAVGLVSGTIKYDNPGQAIFEGKVDGII